MVYRTAGDTFILSDLLRVEVSLFLRAQALRPATPMGQLHTTRGGTSVEIS